jgi:hypothetical protein
MISYILAISAAFITLGFLLGAARIFVVKLAKRVAAA